MVRHFTHQMSVPTRGQGLYEITSPVSCWVHTHQVSAGLLTVFLQHTSASLVIQENADPDVVKDLQEFFARLAPEDAPWYRHTIEGSDDMPAHIKAALTAVQLCIPVHLGKLALGTWQGIYVFEHRDAPHRRSLVLHLCGEQDKL
jgi:secondary thiamine-phosphate synthase enzyme